MSFHVVLSIGRVSLARENEAGGSWGQEVNNFGLGIYIYIIYI